jgi:phenylglyoxylate dehydrogenase alpha subunit
MSQVEVLNGNMAAAHAARLARPAVIAAYPITPQTPVVEYLTQFHADGLLQCEMSEVESEHSAMSVLTGASLTGVRCYTATSSQGLALMYEPYFRASTLRLPIVMNIVNREMISPQTVWGGPQDSLTLRDAGWIQLYVEDNQEILDTTIQAFLIAEHADVLLPVNVCYDGFYLSHMSERVELPLAKDVDAYLPPYRSRHIILDPKQPMAVDPLTNGRLLMEYRRKHLAAQQAALGVIEQANADFAKRFGRSWGGLVEEYRTEDAEYLMISLGSVCGALRECVDAFRARNIRVGLLKIRSLRPFPRERVLQALEGKKGFGVVDRNVSFGTNTGILYQEIRAALYSSTTRYPSAAFIGGLGGEDLTLEIVTSAIEETIQRVKSGTVAETASWLVRPAKRGVQ